MNELHEQGVSSSWGLRTPLVLAAGLGMIAAATTWSMARGAEPGTGEHRSPEAPELFGAATVCPSARGIFERARRLEELGLRRADRYPYDPRDGIRAVHHYRAAESCYRVAGALSDAERLRRAAQKLVLVVNTDYAAARLSLSNALESELWSAALAEVRRLLLLTVHLGEHEYVEWLQQKIGRLEVRVRTRS